METAQVRQSHAELARRTWAHPPERHTRLYRRVGAAGWGRTGLEAVLANSGSNTPGVDGITKKHIDSRTDWGGQEGRRIGQRRLAVAGLAKDAICQQCHTQPATEVHHDPPWREHPTHDPATAKGLCAVCHRQTLQHVVKLDGEPRGSKGACGVRASGGG